MMNVLTLLLGSSANTFDSSYERNDSKTEDKSDDDSDSQIEKSKKLVILNCDDIFGIASRYDRT